MTKNKEDSLKKRYVYKLLANGISIFLSLIKSGIIPRALGPESYGDFSFIQNFFIKTLTIVESGTYNAFYNKLSKRPHEFGLVSFYLRFCTIVFFVIALFIVTVNATKYHTVIFPDQSVVIIYLGLIWGILYFLNNVFTKMMDAYVWTVMAEIAKIFIRVFGVVLLAALFLLNALNIYTYFGYHFIVFVSFCVCSILIYNHKKIVFFKEDWRLSRTQVRSYIKEFYHYSHPLLVMQFILLFSNVAERWFLQKFAGSFEQGYFGFAYNVSQICFLFTNALTPLLTREFSVAHAKGDLKKIKQLFRKLVPTMFAVSCYFSCFVAVHARYIIFFLGGDKYKNAVIPVTILSFLPVFQTYVYLAGSVFLATGKTYITRNIGIFRAVSGLIISYFLIAPVRYYGMDLKATGLCIKLLLEFFLTLNIQLVVISRLLKFSLVKLIVHEGIAVVVFLFFAFFSNFLIESLIDNMYIGFLLSGLIYTLSIIGTTIVFPGLFGLFREDIRKGYDFVKHTAGRVFKKGRE